MNGSKVSVISCYDGNLSAGPKKSDKSAAVSAPTWIDGNVSVPPTSTGRPFPRGAIRPYGVNPSGVGWRLRDFMSVNAPWYPDFRAELLSFPAGRHDDQADALGLVGQLLDLMVKGSKPTPPEKPVYIGYKDALGESVPGDWMSY
jgi:hypothetical protein